jgi:chromosome segregation ATPase
MTTGVRTTIILSNRRYPFLQSLTKAYLFLIANFRCSSPQEDEMTFYNEQIKNLRGETHRRQQRVEKLQSDLEEKQEELNNMPQDPTDHEALSRLKTERNDLDARIRQKDNQIGDKSREVQTLRNKLEHKQSRCLFR